MNATRGAGALAGSCCLCLCASAFGADTGAAATPIRVVTSLTPASLHFGDPVTAEVEVDFDPQTVSAASIRVDPGLTPYVVQSAPASQAVAPGVVRFSYSALCVTDACLPIHGRRVVRLEPATVTASTGSRTVTAVGRWRPVTVSTRLARSSLTGHVRFRSPSRPPTPGYRLSPGTLVALLVGAAALCLVAAVLLVGRPLAGRRRRTVAPGLSALDLAIAYVRDSVGREAADRRRALALLSQTAGETGADPGLVAASATSAWSKPPPTAGTTTDLAEQATRARSREE